MPKRRDDDGNEVPQWVVTYGDLMSLLLCFFILLAAFSELKQEREYLDVVKSVKQAFGYEAGIGRSPTDDPPENSLLQIYEERNLKSQQLHSDTHTPNAQQRSTKTSYITEGTQFKLGGTVTFAPGSAALNEDARSLLRSAADKLRGTRFKVAVKGHAYGVEDLRNGDSLMDLSYKRAKAAIEFLVNECNVSSQILVPVPCADQEPSMPMPYAAATGAEHRRVQIIQTETHVEEVNPDAFGTGRSSPAAPGG